MTNEGDDSEYADSHPGDFPVLFDHAATIERFRSAIRQSGGNRVVARKSGVPKGTIDNLLSGTDVRISAAYAIAAACTVSLDWLLTGHGPETPEWYDARIAERDIPPDQIARGPVMPLSRAELTAPPPSSTAQSQSQRQSGVAEPQESIAYPAGIDTGSLEQAIAIVHTLVGLQTLTPAEAAARIAKTYAILTGAKT